MKEKYLKFPSSYSGAHTYFAARDLKSSPIESDKNVRTDKVTKWRYTRNDNSLPFAWPRNFTAHRRDILVWTWTSAWTVANGSENIYEKNRAEIELSRRVSKSRSFVFDDKKSRKKSNTATRRWWWKKWEGRWAISVICFWLFFPCFFFHCVFHATTNSINHRSDDEQEGLRKEFLSLLPTGFGFGSNRAIFFCWEKQQNLEIVMSFEYRATLWPNLLLSHIMADSIHHSRFLCVLCARHLSTPEFACSLLPSL